MAWTSLVMTRSTEWQSQLAKSRAGCVQGCDAASLIARVRLLLGAQPRGDVAFARACRGHVVWPFRDVECRLQLHHCSKVCGTGKMSHHMSDIIVS
jgi:hypothetical protein